MGCFDTGQRDDLIDASIMYPIYFFFMTMKKTLSKFLIFIKKIYILLLDVKLMLKCILPEIDILGILDEVFFHGSSFLLV